MKESYKILHMKPSETIETQNNIHKIQYIIALWFDNITSNFCFRK